MPMYETGRRTDAPLKRVIATAPRGRSLMLQLECGHAKAHGPRVRTPTAARCPACPA